RSPNRQGFTKRTGRITAPPGRDGRRLIDRGCVPHLWSLAGRAPICRYLVSTGRAAALFAPDSRRRLHTVVRPCFARSVLVAALPLGDQLSADPPYACRDVLRRPRRQVLLLGRRGEAASAPCRCARGPEHRASPARAQATPHAVAGAHRRLRR